MKNDPAQDGSHPEAQFCNTCGSPESQEICKEPEVELSRQVWEEFDVSPLAAAASGYPAILRALLHGAHLDLNLRLPYEQQRVVLRARSAWIARRLEQQHAAVDEIVAEVLGQFAHVDICWSESVENECCARSILPQG